MVTRQAPSVSNRHALLSITPMHHMEIESGYAPDILADLQMITHLLNMGQSLCTQMQSGVDRLCDEVKRITCEHAHLYLGRQRTLKRGDLPPTTLLTLPVQFGHIIYGTLCITFDPLYPEQPSIRPLIAQLLAQVCGWLLYTLEQTSFLQGQCQQLDYQVQGPLTKRERQVLSLMCHGNSQDAIAEALCISPATVGKHRQHIYEQLGVHNEHDAVLVAYQIGLFSPIEDL
ncbi:MAG: response regulator transcription factor [Ktedonobacteraceae bacterium]